MDENLELDEVIRKARKLMAFNADNATQAEVENATGILQRMLDKYQLSMADLDSGEVGEEVLEHEIDSQCKSSQSWMGALISVLATGFGCRAVATKRRTPKGYRVVYRVIGHRSDTVMVDYLFGTLQVALRAMGRADGRKRGLEGNTLRAYVNSYVIGASRAIHKRLEQQRRQPAESASKALVLVKSSAVEDFYCKRFAGERLRTVRANYSSRSGLSDGYRAGERVSLARGVERKDAAPALE